MIAANPMAVFMLGALTSVILLLWGVVLWLSFLSLEDEP